MTVCVRPSRSTIRLGLGSGVPFTVTASGSKSIAAGAFPRLGCTVALAVDCLPTNGLTVGSGKWWPLMGARWCCSLSACGPGVQEITGSMHSPARRKSEGGGALEAADGRAAARGLLTALAP